MQIQIACQHTSLTPALQEHVAQALEKISSHTDKPTHARVVLSAGHPGRDQHRAEATLMVNGKPFHAEAAAPDMYQSIHDMARNLDRMLRKDKTARLSRRSAASLKMA